MSTRNEALGRLAGAVPGVAFSVGVNMDAVVMLCQAVQECRQAGIPEPEINEHLAHFRCLWDKAVKDVAHK